MPNLVGMESQPSARSVGGEDNLKIVMAALEAGQTVQRRESAFSDPGPDWSDVLIDGVALEGSHVNGF